MSPEELRKAASILRERSAGAPSAPWRVLGRGSAVGHRITEGMWGVVADTYPTGGSAEQRANSTFIATMHPGIGLALADALDHAADHFYDYLAPHLDTVAGLILGGES